MVSHQFDAELVTGLDRAAQPVRIKISDLPSALSTVYDS
jgi:hypothetical protein